MCVCACVSECNVLFKRTGMGSQCVSSTFFSVLISSAVVPLPHTYCLVSFALSLARNDGPTDHSNIRHTTSIYSPLYIVRVRILLLFRLWAVDTVCEYRIYILVYIRVCMYVEQVYLIFYLFARLIEFTTLYVSALPYIFVLLFFFVAWFQHLLLSYLADNKSSIDRYLYNMALNV